MSTRRRGARQQRPLDEKTGAVAEVSPTPDTNVGLVCSFVYCHNETIFIHQQTRSQLVVRRVFNYLVFIGVVAGLLYVYYTYFLFDTPTPDVHDVDELNQPFTVIDLPGRGKGAVATRNITVSLYQHGHFANAKRRSEVNSSYARNLSL